MGNPTLIPDTDSDMYRLLRDVAAAANCCMLSKFQWAFCLPASMDVIMVAVQKMAIQQIKKGEMTVNLVDTERMTDYLKDAAAAISRLQILLQENHVQQHDHPASDEAR